MYVLLEVWYILINDYRFTDGEPVKTFSCEEKSPWTPTAVVPDCVSEGRVLNIRYEWVSDSILCQKIKSWYWFECSLFSLEFGNIPMTASNLHIRLLCYNWWALYLS
jgi:hypothetical protein